MQSAFSTYLSYAKDFCHLRGRKRKQGRCYTFILLGSHVRIFHKYSVVTSTQAITRMLRMLFTGQSAFYCSTSAGRS